MKAAGVHGARAEFCCRSGAVGAMKAAEVHGARAGFCCRSGEGSTAAAEAATGAAVEAATRAAAKVTAVAVCCGSVWGATEVAVVSDAWAESSGRGGCGHRGGRESNRGSSVLRQCTGYDRGRCDYWRVGRVFRPGRCRGHGGGGCGHRGGREGDRGSGVRRHRMDWRRACSVPQ